MKALKTKTGLLFLSILLLLSRASLFAQEPEELGPYPVGCRLDTLTHRSVTDSTIRKMDVYTWYPADHLGGLWIEAVQANWLARPVQGDTARPLLVFSHGGCGHPLGNVYFNSHIASWGFIVISTMHPGSMYGEEDCLDSASLHDTWLNRPEDVIYTLDSIIALSREDPDLIGTIDTMRMGMSGHSFGARTTYAVCNRQDWAKCAIPLSGGYGNVGLAPINCMEDIRGVDVPTLTMWGTYDFRVKEMRETYDTLVAPKYGIEIARAGHFHFSDTCTPALDPLCGADSIIPYALAHSAIKHYAVSFLFKYLMGDDRFAAYLCDDYDTFASVSCETTTAIGEWYIDSDYSKGSSVYPNPFSKMCNIFAPIGSKVEIYNLEGDLVDDFYSRDRSIMWEPEHQSPDGIYFIKVSDSDGECLMKVIKVGE